MPNSGDHTSPIPKPASAIAGNTVVASDGAGEPTASPIGVYPSIASSAATVSTLTPKRRTSRLESTYAARNSSDIGSRFTPVSNADILVDCAVRACANMKPPNAVKNGRSEERRGGKDG